MWMLSVITGLPGRIPASADGCPGWDPVPAQPAPAQPTAEARVILESVIADALDADFGPVRPT